MDREDLNVFHSQQALQAFERGEIETARYHVGQDTGFCGTFADWLAWVERTAPQRAEMKRSMEAHSEAWSNAG